MQPSTIEQGPIRLNLGAGGLEIPGYTPIDHKSGAEVYPLSYGDCTVDDIYASHILEHFSHVKVMDVLLDWFRALKPGGRLRLAVPNFAWIAEKYLAGEPINTQGYVMGGHSDDDDHHGSVFDQELLLELLITAGFERIGSFDSEYEDCSSLPVSLNVVAFKPASSIKRPENVVGMLSAPRYGSIMHFRTVGIALGSLGIPYHIGQGAYWHQVLSEQLEELIKSGAEYILTVDYDSVFSRAEVLELYRLMTAFAEADAICGVEMQRGNNRALFGVSDRNGEPVDKLWLADTQRHLTAINSGHFGLTIFRTKSLDAMPRPWMVGKPNEQGRWGKDHVDADIEFWHRWREAGKTLYMANNVIVGHMAEVIRWPSPRMQCVWQEPSDYIERGIPPEAIRNAVEASNGDD